jgi:hypothetical protein
MLKYAALISIDQKLINILSGERSVSNDNDGSLLKERLSCMEMDPLSAL